MMGLLAPALLGVQAGSMIGYLAQHALGRYDLPLPTGPPPVGDSPGGDAPTLCFVVSERRRVRGGVVPPARRPALLPRAPRSRARGGPIGPVGARPARATRRRLRLELRDRPVGVRSGVRDDRSPGPRASIAADDREPRAGARRDAVAAPGRAPGGAAAAHRRRSRATPTTCSTQSAGAWSPRSTDPRGDAAPPRRARRGRAVHRGPARAEARARALRAGAGVLSTAWSSGPASKG